MIGRVIAEGLRQVLGQNVVVDNRGGAGGSIGTAAIAKALPDGHTIGMGTASTLTRLRFFCAVWHVEMHAGRCRWSVKEWP